MEEFIQKTLELDYNQLIGFVIKYGTRIIVAGFVFWIGFKIVNKILNVIENSFEKTKVSENIRPFLLNIIEFVLKVIVLFIVLNILGANLSSLVALIAAVGFAIGMSLQGSLSNFASGILILTLKPYKVGNWIQINDKFGKVTEIKIFNTVLVTPGKKTLIIPNSKITDDIVTNYSEKGVIRLEIDVHIPYESDWKKVKKILEETIKTVPKVLTKPEVEIGIADFDSHSLLIIVRPYAKPDDYWEVMFNAHEKLKEALHQNGIAVPYSEGIQYGKFGK